MATRHRRPAEAPDVPDQAAVPLMILLSIQQVWAYH
jgi:hypothetical protein